jgi:hypothetical protein
MWGNFNQLNLMALIHITETACDEGDGLSHLTGKKAKAVRPYQNSNDYWI